MQNDLVTLFAKQMRMDTPISSGNQEMPLHTPSPITYSITQHYHHSSHVARCPLPAGYLEQSESLSLNTAANSIYETLRLHNISPSSLSSTQLHLFENALPEQRSRLIQIWQICPEPSGASSDPRTERASQSIFELEADASCAGKSNANGPDHSAQTMYTDDLEMCDSVHDRNNDDEGHQYAEPYMISGYEILVQRDYKHSTDKLAPVVNEPTTGSPYKLASDPIYKSQGHRWWECSQSDVQEYQYGVFEEMDRYADCGFIRSKWLA